MALSKIQAESMNLADTFAFTGTVSGASNFVHLTTTTVTTAVASVDFDNISTDYDDFLLTFRCHPVTDNVRMDFRFLNASGAAITGSTDYGYGVGYTDGMSNYSNSNGGGSIPISSEVGGASNEARYGWFYLLNRNADASNANEGTPNIHGHSQGQDAGGNQSGTLFAGQINKSPFVTADTIRGFKIYMSSGNIDTDSRFVLWGLKR